MPLPHFLALICITILAAGLTLWFAASVGVPLAMLGMVALIAAGVARLAARVE